MSGVTVEALLNNDPLVSPNPNDPNDAKLLLAAARHVEPMKDPVAFPKKFMTSSWHANTSIWKLLTETRDPIKALLYDLMYLGPLPKKEGKLPVISVWDQREYHYPVSRAGGVVLWPRPSLPDSILFPYRRLNHLTFLN